MHFALAFQDEIPNWALKCTPHATSLLIPVAPTASAQPQKEKAVLSIEQAKLQVAKLGLGEKARATITMKDGSKTKATFTAPAKMISSFVIERRTRRRQFDMWTWPR